MVVGSHVSTAVWQVLTNAGGNAICPGRLLAKRVTLFTIALMTRDYDMEISDVPLQLGSMKFGMGVDKPKKPIPFRIRKRHST